MKEDLMLKYKEQDLTDEETSLAFSEAHCCACCADCDCGVCDACSDCYDGCCLCQACECCSNCYDACMHDCNLFSLCCCLSCLECES